MDHHSAEVGISIEDPITVDRTAVDGAVNCANSVLRNPAADVDINMELVYIFQSIMRLEELGDNEFNRSCLVTDTRKPELFEEKVPIPATLGMNFDSKTPPNPP